MNIKSAILISSSLLLLTTPVLAEDSTTTAATRPAIQQKIETRKASIEQRRLAEASRAAMFGQKLEDMKAKIASREAAVKAKLQQFKDQRKASIALRVNTNLNKINQNQTDQMLKHLDKMTALLDKLEARVSSNSPDIKNPAAANQAISDAREAVANAKTAVQAQAQKDYTLQVSTETKIRTDAKSMRDQLHTDLSAVRKQVIAAKQKVADAVRIAKSGPVPDSTGLTKEATKSGQQ